MNSRLFAGLLIVLGLLSIPESTFGQSHERAVESAKEEARAWFQLLDADKYVATWETASPLFKSGISAEQWAARLKGVHGPLGSMKERTLVAARYTTTLPRAPKGEYVVAQYRAAYPGREVVETITLKKGPEGWKMAKFLVKPVQQK